MHIDFKVTCWERVEIPKEHEEKVKQALKEGKINSANDVFNLDYDMSLDCDMLLDTSEQLSIEENGGYSTVEVWEQVKAPTEPMEITWKNGE